MGGSGAKRFLFSFFCAAAAACGSVYRFVIVY